MDSFRGLPLITESSALNNLSVNSQTSMYDPHVARLINILIQYQSQLYDEKDRNAKDSLKRQIQDIYDEIIFAQIGDSGNSADEYRQSSVLASRPFVLWQLYFPKVFRDNGGFDIAIGNPPYVQLQKTVNEDTKEKLGDSLSKLGFNTFTKTGDIYCLFYEKGYRLLRDGGVLAFITSNKWMRAGYGEKLRAFFAEKTNPVCLIDFAGQKVFESATVDVNILIFSKGINQGHTKACTVRESRLNNLSVYVEQNNMPTSFENSSSWTILSQTEADIKAKIEAIGIPLKDWNVSINYGVKTGFNDAFIINGAKKDELIAEDAKSAEIIRPILRGRDIKRYGYAFADLWLINVHNGMQNKGIAQIQVEHYPAIKAHLDKYYAKLVQRADKGNTPYNLRRCTYMDDFSKQKIVYAETMRVHKNNKAERFPRFSFLGEEMFLDKTCFMITGNHLLYILPIINSALMQYHIQHNIAVLDTGGFLMQKIYVEDLPIPPMSKDSYKLLSELSTEILSKRTHGESTQALEEMVDMQTYEMFDLNGEEIRYIESKRIDKG